MLQGMPSWDEDKFDEKSNPDLTKLAWKLWNIIKNKGKKASIIHVRGHNKKWKKFPWGTWEKYAAETNECADRLANHARKTLDRGTELIEQRSYD